MTMDRSLESLLYTHGPLTDQPNSTSAQGAPGDTARPEFDPTTDQVLETHPLPGGYVQVIYMTKDGARGTALIPPASGSVGGSGSGLGWAQLANTQANQAAAQAGQQASLAETIRQFNEQMGMDKARGDQQMRLSQQQADEKAAMDQQNYQLALRRFGLDQQSQDFSQYTKLADLASNPRNYVQTFFMNRGQQAPVDVARYGNTPSNASQIMPFQQWQQSYPGTQRQPMGPASGPQGYNPTPGYGSAYEGLNSFNPANGKVRLAPNDPDAAGLLAKNPSLYEMNSPENVMKYTPQQPKMMARGGNVTMYVPHALVNLATGRTVAIAGERGMETAHFDGAAIIDPLADKNIGEAVPMPDYSAPPDPTAPAPGPAPTQPTPTDPSLTSSTAPGAGTTQTGPAFGLTPELLAQAQALAAQANAANQAALAKQAQPTQQVAPPQLTALATANPYVPLPSLSDLVTPGTQGGPVSYGDSVSPQMPTYLSGENFQAASPITTALQNTPFLKRIYGQARGDQNYGTDRPQQTNLPSDLPLISQLAWTQLSPSEQQGFLSYVSSLGVDPNDYLNMIRQSSPHGGSAQSPSFGNNIPYLPQNY